MPWIIASMLILAAVFSYMGWKWDSTRQRPSIRKLPLVSILIPSYKSSNLMETVESAKALDYPNKEVIVVDDSPERLHPIEGVRIIQNKKRLGKSRALNEAVKQAKGEILYFLDSDTITEQDALKKLVPWFSKDVAAVSPRFTVKNRSNLLSRLISLEHGFLSALFKIHMYFGSLISFRGCGIAIRKDVFLELGGWKETTIEDTDLAATMLENGYKIIYEPDAVVKTYEPSTIREFKKQRMRWGRGTGFSFLNHYKFYLTNPQFGLYVFPYLLLLIAISGFLLYNTTVYLLPLASLYFIYTVSISHLMGVFIVFLFPLFSSVFASVTAASITHFAIVTNSEREELKDIALAIPYVMVYFPFTILIYIWGSISAMNTKRKAKKELDLTSW